MMTRRIIAFALSFLLGHNSLAVFNLSPLYSKISREWTVLNGGSAATGLVDNFGGTAVDSAGNVYVSGNSTGPVNGGKQIGDYTRFITKYTPTGTVLWTVSDGVAAGVITSWGIALDSSANVYVIGWVNRSFNGQIETSTLDYIISKYSTNGVHLWTIQGGGSGPGATTYGTGIVVDSSGNIFITGYTNVKINGQTQSGINDLIIVKYSSSGVHQWTIQKGAAAGTTRGNGITVDSSGNIYVTGTTTVAIDGQIQRGIKDFFISKYNNSGTLQWTVQDGTSMANINMYYSNITVDSSDNVYVTGSTDKALDGQALQGTGAATNLFITKYNSSGTRQWTVVKGGTGLGVSVEGAGIAVDFAGNVYITGHTVKSLDGQPQLGVKDFIISKYNTSGVWQWTVQKGAAAGTSEAWGIALDLAANVYVMGNSNKALDGQSLSGNVDLIVTKYSPLGTRQWTLQSGGSAGNTYAWAIAVDPSSNTYIAGTATVAINGQVQKGNKDLIIAKYNSSGVRQWTIQNGGTNGTTIATGIAVDSSSNVYVTGWTTVGIDSQAQAGVKDLFITKYNSTGIRQWTVQTGVASGYTNPTGIAVDSSGNAYVTGWTTKGINAQTQIGAQDLFITKYNTSGVQQWTIQNGVALGFVNPNAIAVDSSANIYITGWTDKAIDGQTQSGVHDLFITRYNSSGVRQWTVQDGDVLGAGTTFGNSIAVDSSANIYISGNTTAAIDGESQKGSMDMFLSKYNTSGVRQWTKQVGNVSSNPYYNNNLAVDVQANVYIAGNTTAAFDGQVQRGKKDLFVTKYNTSGTKQWTIQEGASQGTTYANSIALDSSGNIYLTGSTNTGFNGQTLTGVIDMFVTKY